MHHLRLNPHLMAILGLMLLGLMSRLIPHPPNFTSINAIALVGALFLDKRWLTFTIVFCTLFLSDLLLGIHSTMHFVYLSFGLTICIGHQLKNTKSLSYFPLACIASSLLFFFITNLGIWLTGSLYSKTLEGLTNCYLAALPFLTHQILGDLTYSILLLSYFIYGKSWSKQENLHF